MDTSSLNHKSVLREDGFGPLPGWALPCGKLYPRPARHPRTSGRTCLSNHATESHSAMRPRADPVCSADEQDASASGDCDWTPRAADEPQAQAGRRRQGRRRQDNAAGAALERLWHRSQQCLSALQAENEVRCCKGALQLWLRCCTRQMVRSFIRVHRARDQQAPRAITPYMQAAASRHEPIDEKQLQSFTVFS